jgi:type IV pilus biogenesis protein CpaD/CtpE
MTNCTPTIRATIVSFLVGLAAIGCSSGTPASREPTFPEETETEPPEKTDAEPSRDVPVLSAEGRKIVEELRRKGGGALHSP